MPWHTGTDIRKNTAANEPQLAQASRLLLNASLTASSVDTSSPACVASKTGCGPHNVVDDGRQSIEDDSLWRSALDSSCAKQWIKASFDQPYAVASFSIEYPDDPASRPSSVNQANSNTPAIPEFVFQLFPYSNNSAVNLVPIDSTSALSCLSSESWDVNRGSILDTCTLTWTDGLPIVYVGAQWTWTPVRNGSQPCQVAVMEMAMVGTGASDILQNVVDGVNSPPIDGAWLPQPPSQSQNTSSTMKTTWLGVGITLAVIAALAATVFSIRQRKLYRRKRAQRLLVDDNGFLNGM
ncbi:hypothetical protein BC830DRAFT_1128353 [Chytriomyces sp. MP71]|nr:hypothetical protein BC830DRAFT_1128353 [Chytriomyces sp. MP71]